MEAKLFQIRKRRSYHRLLVRPLELVQNPQDEVRNQAQRKVEKVND